jgi:hypothetical protein
MRVGDETRRYCVEVWCSRDSRSHKVAVEAYTGEDACAQVRVGLTSGERVYRVTPAPVRADELALEQPQYAAKLTFPEE